MILDNPYPKLDQAAFLKKHNISPQQFERTELDWALLCEIRGRHCAKMPELQSKANSISQQLQLVPSVHSLKIRIKHPDHLVEKIIRKKSDHLELPDQTERYEDCTCENYERKITDLIGVRALHLFKDEWQTIHGAVKEIWDLHEDPIAYHREGDDTSAFQSVGCDIRKHKFGYRSVHYVVKFNLTKRTDLAEIQVRTIFEEAWSEIDHSVRYPRQSDEPQLKSFLSLFNRVAGYADEMGSFTKSLCQQLREHSEKLKATEAQAEAAQQALKEAISKIDIGKKEKTDLLEKIDSLQRAHAEPFTFTVNGLEVLSQPFTMLFPNGTVHTSYNAEEFPLLRASDLYQERAIIQPKPLPIADGSLELPPKCSDEETGDT